MWRKVFLCVFLGIVLAVGIAFLKWQACQTSSKPNPQDQPVARVYDQYFYKSDLDSLTADTQDAKEKAEMAKQYIQNWMAKQLLIAEAQASDAYNKADIERRVLDYRYALLVHNHIERLVNAQLDRKVGDQEIEAYYQEQQENFTLRHNVFRGRFIVVPQNAPNKAQLRKLLVAQGEKNLKALQAYCAQFAKDYSLDENKWLPWDELIQGTILGNARDKTRWLKQKKVLRTNDNAHFYYFKIDEYRTINDIAPLVFVKDQIRNIIIHKRKIQLANKIKEDILQQAKNNDHCAIYEY